MLENFWEKIRGTRAGSEESDALQLINDTESFTVLITTVSGYYRARQRSIFMVHYKEPKEGTDYLVRFVVDRKYAVEYYIDSDPRMGGFFGGVRLAIGPEYVNPIVFWSDEADRRFYKAATKEAIQKNLALLDEFFRK
jgi:hypothetical protein